MAIAEKKPVKRAKRRLEVRFGVKEADTTGFTRNLSETGLFIETSRALAPDTVLQLEICTPDRVFHMSGKVVWAKRYPARLAHSMRGGMGCLFIRPSQDWLDFYRDWVASN